MTKRLENLILRRLAEEPTDYWHLLVTTSAQYKLFQDVLSLLLSQDLIFHQDALYSLTQKGKKRVRQEGLDQPLLTNDAFAQLSAIAAERPERKDELDQALAPMDVILNRLAILHEHGDLHQTRVAMLGDDDCMGVALALTDMVKEVVILEYDPELCAHYKRYNLPNVRILQHDLCQPVPSDIQGRCDLFFTDPCPSLEMLKIFISRGLECLRGEGCVGYTATSQTEASAKKWHTLQKLILEAGCTISELRPNVTTYDLEGDWLMQTGWNVVEKAPFPPPKPTLHWYCSGLMRLETVCKPTPFVRGGVEMQTAIYKDPEVILTEQERVLYTKLSY